MYDERTRRLDHQWATYAYAREEGIEYGMEWDRAEGRKVRSNNKIRRKAIAKWSGVSVKIIERDIKEI